MFLVVACMHVIDWCSGFLSCNTSSQCCGAGVGELVGWVVERDPRPLATQKKNKII
jgi:hypothetical protein